MIEHGMQAIQAYMYYKLPIALGLSNSYYLQLRKTRPGRSQLPSSTLHKQDHLEMSIRAPRKGENYELSVDLNSEYRDKRKDAIKRTIASMTVGKGTFTVFWASYSILYFLLDKMSAVFFRTSSRICRPTISSRKSSCISIL
jgi:hypothetical protein